MRNSCHSARIKRSSSRPVRAMAISSARPSDAASPRPSRPATMQAFSPGSEPRPDLLTGGTQTPISGLGSVKSRSFSLTTRRQFQTLAATGLLTAASGLSPGAETLLASPAEASEKKGDDTMALELPALPYAYDALA